MVTRGTPRRWGLHSVTVKAAQAEQFVALAAQAGFGGIEFRLDDIAVYTGAGGRLAVLARQIKEAGLTVIRVAFPVGWQGSEGQDRQMRFDGIRRTMDAARELGAETVGSPFALRSLDVPRAIADLREVAGFARAVNIPLSMEFLGFAERWRDIRSAWALVQQARMDNVHLLLDTFHLYRGGSDLADLRLVPASRIALVHVNDAPARPPQELQDTDRVLPGEGGLPLRTMFEAIHGHGYRGWYSLEVLGPAVWDRDPAQVARDGAMSLRAAVRDVLGGDD
jgi:2-keto-myo-inositol isomerase